MSDLPPDGSEDRLVGLDPVEGFAFESDGSPIAELDVDAPDSRLDRGETVAEQAIGERWWRFGHVIVDEAQDLTPMQWRMLARRSSGGSITIVGDLAQRSIGEPGRWQDHLPAELGDVAVRELTVNYRSPAEINEVAAALLAHLAPGITAPASIRSVGHRPTVRHLPELARNLPAAVAAERAARPRGRTAVIGLIAPDVVERGRTSAPDVQWLDPWQAKGLEFDSVILVEPADITDRDHGPSLLYVAVTRTTDHLLVVHDRPLPEVLAASLDRT
ncbi:MAG: ATP-binding domain-containing protein [Acidimicrobiales bacterium]